MISVIYSDCQSVEKYFRCVFKADQVFGSIDFIFLLVSNNLFNCHQLLLRFHFSTAAHFFHEGFVGH